MFGIRPSLTVTRNAALFHSLFSYVLEIAQPSERLPIFLWLKRATSIATPMFLRTWRKGSYRVTMQLYVCLVENRLFGDTRANAFRVGRRNIPFSDQS